MLISRSHRVVLDMSRCSVIEEVSIRWAAHFTRGKFHSQSAQLVYWVRKNHIVMILITKHFFIYSGFEPKMTRREASLILELSYVVSFISHSHATCRHPVVSLRVHTNSHCC